MKPDCDKQANGKIKRGDWVAEREVPQPLFGRVIEAFDDDFGDGPALNIVVYDLKGNKVGRRSPAVGGPTTFEPACPASQYRRIKPPRFPIERVGLYGNYDHLLIDA